MKLGPAALVLGACLPFLGVVAGATWLDGAALDVGRLLAARTRTWLRLPEPEAVEFVTADERPIGDTLLPKDADAVPHSGAVNDLPPRAAVSRSTRSTDGSVTEASPSLEPPATSRFVSAGQVLELARLGVVPRGTPAGGAGERPPGVSYSRVAAFGVGLREGDVLTHVAGQTVRSEEDVVTLVLSARQRRTSRISGRFWRAGESHEIVVEMPYTKQSVATRASGPGAAGLGG